MTEALEFHHLLERPQEVTVESLRRVMLKIIKKKFDDPTLATAARQQPILEGTTVPGSLV